MRVHRKSPVVNGEGLLEESLMGDNDCFQGADLFFRCLRRKGSACGKNMCAQAFFKRGHQKLPLGVTGAFRGPKNLLQNSLECTRVFTGVELQRGVFQWKNSEAIEKLRCSVEKSHGRQGHVIASLI